MSGEPPLPELLPGPAPNGLAPLAYAEAITARSGSSFSAGMAILPRPRRAAMRAIYAFCRIVDDIADGDFLPADKRGALEAWRREVEMLYTAEPTSAIGRALAPAIATYDLPQDELLAMIDGMEMDANGPIIAPSREALSLYTRRVAGTVGMLSMRVFGAWVGEASERFALALGDALQLTNILRDIEADADIGRLYLPREVLEAHGVPADDPTAAARHRNLPEVCRFLGKEARAGYDHARQYASDHRRSALRPALLMMGAYEGYLDRMEALDWQRHPDEMRLSGREKLVRGLKYALFGPGPNPETKAA